jgi:phosphocarrier protein HPr
VATVERALVLTNAVGLHARPASLWVQTAARFKSTIIVTCDGRVANARRILEVLQLGAGPGARLTVRAEGEDAEEAIAALTALVDSRFGEDG